MMELRNLRAFLEVVRQGGFSRAAPKLFATQSTVSKSVKQLETELEVVLLDRSVHRPLSLTPAGEIVLRRAQRLLTEREDLLTELEELRGVKRGVLRLGLPPIGSARLFAPVFAAYRSQYPGVEIELTEHGSARLETLLREGAIELAGLLAPVPEEFEAQPVHREPIVALLPGAHPLARQRDLGLSQLAEMPFLLYEQGFALNPIILRACERARVTPNVAARSSQIDFLAALVTAGIGAAFMPRMIAASFEGPTARMVAIRDAQMVWEMTLCWRRNGYLSHAAQAWLGQSQEVFTSRTTSPGPEPPRKKRRSRPGD